MIRIEFVYDPRELREGLRALGRRMVRQMLRRHVILFSLYFTFIVGLVALWYLVSKLAPPPAGMPPQPVTWSDWIWPAFPPAAILIALVVTLRRRQSRIIASPFLAVRHVIELSESGVSLDRTVEVTRYAWEAFSEWMETKSTFALRVIGLDRVVIIPKRAMTTTTDVELARELFRRHVVPRTHRFQVVPITQTKPTATVPADSV